MSRRLARGNGKPRGNGAPEPAAAVIEAILFASDRPVTVAELSEALPEASRESLLDVIERLAASCEAEGRGFRVQSVAGGYQLTTAPEFADHVERFLIGKRRARLSRAALETLATIAYRQPITRGEIEQLRGVDSGHVLHTLISRDLVTVRGRSQALGRPLLYGTTPQFLSYFGLQSMGDLPNLEEIQALVGEDPLDDPEIVRALETSGLLEAEGLAEGGAGVDEPRGEGTPEEAQPSARELEDPRAEPEDPAAELDDPEKELVDPAREIAPPVRGAGPPPAGESEVGAGDATISIEPEGGPAPLGERPDASWPLSELVPEDPRSRAGALPPRSGPSRGNGSSPDRRPSPPESEEEDLTGPSWS